jgi:hypothetical protein
MAGMEGAIGAAKPPTIMLTATGVADRSRLIVGLFARFWHGAEIPYNPSVGLILEF